MDTLHYTSPAHGGWSVVRIGMLVPQSRMLFICPFACGRHGAIGAAIDGNKERLSYLFVDQSDIIDGYDDLIIEKVPELLDIIGEHPRVLFLFVSCLDDLIGTDHEAIEKELEERYGDIIFRFCHMNPISLDSSSPPPVTMQRKMYGLLKGTGKRRKAVNLIGNLDNISPASELRAFLNSGGYSVHHISEMKSYDEYQMMGDSAFNLVVAPQGVYAAREMEERLGIPYSFFPVDYSMKNVEESYEKLARILEIGDFDFTQYKEKALESIRGARSIISSYPIAVSSSGVIRPYSAARALIEYGFNVRMVISNKAISSEKDDEKWIREKHPEIEIADPIRHTAATRRDIMRMCITLGVEGAYLTGSIHPVDISVDAHLYGYEGISTLCNKLVEAYESSASLEHLILKYNLVV